MQVCKSPPEGETYLWATFEALPYFSVPMRIVVFFLLSCLFFTSSAVAQGSSRAELEARRQRILEQMQQTKAELAETKKDTRASMGQLRALQAQVNARQKLIGSINTELSQIDGTIQESAKEVGTLQQQLDLLRLRYAQSLRYAYRNRNSESMMAYLFSASNFNEGIRRLAYLRKFRTFRMSQADQIRNIQGNLSQQIGVLNNQKQRKNVLRQVEESQRQVLQSEAQQTDQVVRELKGREGELAAQVTENQKAARGLERAISAAIRQEIEIARKKAQEEARRREELRRRQEEEQQRALAAKKAADAAAAKTAAARSAAAKQTPEASNNGGNYAGGKVGVATGSNATGRETQTNTPAEGGTITTTPSTTVAAAIPTPRAPKVAAAVNLGLTPEAAALSAGFAANRGRLPWPVEKGFIISQYGRHPHPIAEKVMIENDGVDIQTSPGATARAVFEGTVSKIFYVPGFGNNVLINHGEYFTVYNGLSGVSVAAGQQVKTKQSIGTVGPNDEGVHVIKFQVWKGASTQNPMSWIAQ
jgi:septal ring factor EnvC (AmiA/AmiB activator)